MSTPGNPQKTPLRNRVRESRQAKGWTQQELAQRTGLSRPGVSAIEAQRLVPSAAAALALAEALGSSVEELFLRPGAAAGSPQWAWPARSEPCRFWEAEVSGRRLLYPVDDRAWTFAAHDGVLLRHDSLVRGAASGEPRRTLVLAGCDPAAQLLAAEMQRQCGIRVLLVHRPSRQGLELVKQGLVHAAGVHLGGAGRDNRAVVDSLLGPGHRLLRIAQWDAGIASAPARRIRSAKAALGARVRWIGRELGSGARQCLDELFGNRPAPRRLAPDHRGVSEAVRDGWADAGVCVRLTSEEAGLDFLLLRREAYDVCFAAGMQGDPRIKALIQVVRSPAYRSTLADLPGYDSRETGTIH